MEAVSLFTGCGGSDRGLADAGWRIVMANDNLPYAKEVYEENLPERISELRTLKTSGLFLPLTF